MKIITLDEAAYERLYAWKTNAGESISSVIMRMIPIHGTLGAFLSYSEIAGSQDAGKDCLIEESINERSSVKQEYRL